MLNKPNFLKKFGCFDSIMRLKELDDFLNDSKLFSKEFKDAEKEGRKQEGDPNAW